MINQIKNDIIKTLDKYKDNLWYVKVSGCSYGDPYDGDNRRYDWSKEDIYVGSKNDVEKVINLQHMSPKIEQFDFNKHNIVEMINAQEEYKKIYVPRSAGDIVLYQGQECRVTGFSGMNAWINFKGEGTLLNEDETKKLKLIKSKYWGES